MVERIQSKRRRIMKDFIIRELSAVDRPAQGHALAVLMKRADDESADKSYGDYPQAQAVAEVGRGIEAMDFEEAMAEDQSREDAQRIKDRVWAKWNALQHSFGTIACDDALDPADKVPAMQESLGQFLDAVRAESAPIADTIEKSFSAVPALAELLPQNGSEGDIPMTDAEKRQLDELQKSVADLTSKLEAATAKDPAKKAAELQGELEKAAAQLAEANEKIKKMDTEKVEAEILAKMSDAEKEYMAGLDGAAKMKFMQATPEDRKKMMSKAADADPVVYKAADGTEFRKSDGDKMVALAKRADEADKLAKTESEKRETSELAKRADDELKIFSEEVAKRDDKIEVLRAISKMEAGPRAALEKMLSVGGKAISAAFETIGRKNEDLEKSDRDFDKRVSEIMARDKVGKLEALDKAAREFPTEYAAYQASGARLSN